MKITEWKKKTKLIKMELNKFPNGSKKCWLRLLLINKYNVKNNKYIFYVYI